MWLAVVLCVRRRTLVAIINFNSGTYLQLTESSSVTYRILLLRQRIPLQDKVRPDNVRWYLDNCFKSSYRETRYDVGYRPTYFGMPTVFHTYLYISNKGNPRDMKNAEHRFTPPCDRTCIMCLFAPSLSSRLWSAPTNRQRNLEEGKYFKYRHDFVHLYSYYKEAYKKLPQYIYIYI